MRLVRGISAFLAIAALTLGVSAPAHAGGNGYLERDRSAARATNTMAARPAGDIFVDLVAAEFFESNLRLAQSRQIEADTARRYLALSAAERAHFRAERKKLWREMSAGERLALRGAKRPRFSNLDEAQKQTFRRIASEELGAASDPSARNGI